MITLLAITTLLFAIASGTETIVMAVLGAFGTLIVQGIKKFSGGDLQGTKALNLTVVVSLALATIGAFAADAFTVNGEFTFSSVMNGALVVFGVSTLAYKYLISGNTAPTVTPAA